MSRLTVLSSLVCLMMGTSLAAFTQDAATIQKKLVSDYALTQPTAAFDDIVTAGAVLVLQKGPLMMVAVSSSVNPYPSTYKDGKIKNPLGTGRRIWGTLSQVPGISSPTGPQTRTFVAGEKMWVTKIDTREDAIVFDLFTDAYSDVRYKTSLTFPFPKGRVLSADEAEKLVGEVLKVQPAEEAKTDAQQPAPGVGQQAATSQQPTEAVPAPIPPPPPPPADPKTIALGQTPDQVTAALGQPEKIVKLGTKQTYYYKDMKVIFVNGKVSDVQ